MDSRAKHPALGSVVEGLRSALGLGYFVEVDHWDGDPLAVGLARPDDRRVLVYVAVTPDTNELFYECEVPAEAPDEIYEVTARNENAGPEELLAVVRSHLAPGSGS